MLSMTLEICVDNLESAIIASACGAHRIELCDDLSVEGLTPSIELLKDTKELINIPVFSMIRPRPGNFYYNKSEVQMMKVQIKQAHDLNANGLVFGALDKNNKVDIDVCKELLAASCGLPVTFHRAFDLIEDKETALEDLIHLGFKRVLTSGGEATAEEGAKQLKELILQSDAGRRIVVMPGGGITDENIDRILLNTGATEVHGSCRSKDPSSVLSKVCSAKSITRICKKLKEFKTNCSLTVI